MVILEKNIFYPRLFSGLFLKKHPLKILPLCPPKVYFIKIHDYGSLTIPGGKNSLKGHNFFPGGLYKNPQSFTLTVPEKNP